MYIYIYIYIHYIVDNFINFNLPPLTTTHVICEDWSLNHKDWNQLLNHHILWQYGNVHSIHPTWFKTFHKTSFLIFDILLIICPNGTIYSYLQSFSIMYTTMYSFFQKCKLNWKKNTWILLLNTIQWPFLGKN